jgi:hypothetical protein
MWAVAFGPVLFAVLSAVCIRGVVGALGFELSLGRAVLGWVLGLLVVGVTAALSEAVAERSDRHVAMIGSTTLVATSPVVLTVGAIWPEGTVMLLVALGGIGVIGGSAGETVPTRLRCLVTAAWAGACCGVGGTALSSLSGHGLSYLHSSRVAWELAADPDPLYTGEISALTLTYRIADFWMWSMWVATLLAIPLLFRRRQGATKIGVRRKVLLSAGVGFVIGSTLWSGGLGLAGLSCVVAALVAAAIGELRGSISAGAPRAD